MCVVTPCALRENDQTPRLFLPVRHSFCVDQEMMFAAALRNASALRLKGVRYAAEFSGRARVRSRPTLRHAAPPHSTLALRHTRFNWRS